MMLEVDHHSGIPVYKQIIQQISMAISSGMLNVGDPLPSIRQVAGMLEVNPMTVSKAYSFLEHDGLVNRRPGRPLVVAERPEEEQQIDRAQHLIEALKPAVATAKQLEFTTDEAVQIFKEMLEQ